MIISMTGFGQGNAEVGGIKANVEISSVNSRYCEVYIRMPRMVQMYEPTIQNLVKKALERGKINVNIQIEDTTGESTVPPIAEGVVRAYAHRLGQIATVAGIDEPVRLEHLIRFTDIFAAREGTEESANYTWKAIEEALEKALANMRDMRTQEGAALGQDFALRAKNIHAALTYVEARAPQRIEEARVKILERIEQIIDNERIDKDRLELEVAILVDKMDVTEEIVRLKSHFVLFDEALVMTEPSGRRLNFLVQELNREINTIGSKANDAEVTTFVIQMKEELEKIREQVQNIV
jgi:uncharacterized protein (TIGR00255 family)